VTLEKVEAIADILSHGVMSTPGVVDGQVAHAGGVRPRPRWRSGWASGHGRCECQNADSADWHDRRAPDAPRTSAYSTIDSPLAPMQPLTHLTEETGHCRKCGLAIARHLLASIPAVWAGPATMRLSGTYPGVAGHGPLCAGVPSARHGE
jgi:hypothetical protein